jgi:demethylmenaquinone methyltransferase/2-methoxy-6-polyprenyl-1,4-benzoquinol methylase
MPFSQLEPMLKRAALPTDGLLLDVGGGTGRVAAALRHYVRRAFVADFSHGMLLQARAKGLHSIQTPAEQLPFLDGVFERIIMVDALHHVNHQSRTIGELWRVLKPGGCLVIEEPDLRAWQVKILAVVEKLLLMRSHFLAPPEIAALFPPEARIRIEVDGYNAWIIVRKE